MKPSAQPAAPVATVDAQNPWLGLVSFTEETRAYFHGRDEEAAELSRRVQRKLLTVLFGQSGLGKTSILQAGLVPRLRPEGFCPVYVRLDYDPHSPSPAEQIKRAVFRATAAAGSWTQSGTAVAGETLWEFLHHRDDVLKDAAGRTLIPILIFDQFEEIFTLAQSDDAGRKRAEEFLADLADLVENRPPVALEARIDRDETDAAKFDFARADYRILISLREDYLAHLEGLKGRMPSVTQNRMRLARMTGPQAVAAARAPAPQLMSEAVAEAVVRFVAGGTDLARAEVEPSLLSLICRELNNNRLAKQEAEISADLLAGSRDTILTEFYERVLADQPAGVRVFIEDEMLTDSGFRESVAEERVRKAFAAAGAPAGALADLVDRRLLRVEDRLDMRRVEITHDVLCSVISASRGVRHEREALEASRRELAAQAEREQATRLALKRARLVAAVATTVMVVAVGSAIFGWINYRRAQAAEAEAHAAQLLTQRARGEAEKLVGFLLEDFYEELSPTGRVELIAKLADKAVAYYDGLPPELITPQTELYRGMALVRKASALTDAGRFPEARAAAGQARKIFEQMRAAGDQRDEVTAALAFSLFAPMTVGAFGDQRSDLESAVGLLRPLIKSGRADRVTRITFADMLQYLAHAMPDPKDGYDYAEESRRILGEMGAIDLTDLTAASLYGDVTDTQSRMAQRLGRIAEAEKLAGIVSDMATKVLEQRPGDLRAMKNRFYGLQMLGTAARDRHDLANAERLLRESVEAVRYYTRFNPTDTVGWQMLGAGLIDLGQTHYEQGRLTEARARLRDAADLEYEPQNKSGMVVAVYWAWNNQTRLEARSGNLQAAREAVAAARRSRVAVVKDRGLDAELDRITELSNSLLDCDILAAEGKYAEAHARAVEVADELAKIQVKSPGNEDFRTNGLRVARVAQIESGLRLGLDEEAVTASRQLLAQPLYGRGVPQGAKDLIEARNRLRLGEALLGTGRRDEALATLTEAEKYFRGELAQGANDTDFLLDCARCLQQVAQAQAGDAAGRAKRLALLEEAMRHLGGLSVQAQQLIPARELIDGVGAALRTARAEAGR